MIVLVLVCVVLVTKSAMPPAPAFIQRTTPQFKRGLEVALRVTESLPNVFHPLLHFISQLRHSKDSNGDSLEAKSMVDGWNEYGDDMPEYTMSADNVTNHEVFSDRTVLINVPAEQLFRAICDFENYGVWAGTGLKSVKKVCNA